MARVSRRGQHLENLQVETTNPHTGGQSVDLSLDTVGRAPAPDFADQAYNFWYGSEAAEEVWSGYNWDVG